MASDEQAIRHLILEWNQATAAADVDAVKRRSRSQTFRLRRIVVNIRR
jgi:hypothetical protein